MHAHTHTLPQALSTPTVWCQIWGIWVISKWDFYLMLVIISRNCGWAQVFVCWLSPVVTLSVITPHVAMMSARLVCVCPFIFVCSDRFISYSDRFKAEFFFLFLILPFFWKSVPYQAEQNSQILNMYTEPRAASLWHVNNSQIKHFQQRPDRHTLTYQISCLDHCRSNQSPLCVISMIKEHAATHVHTHSSASIEICVY